MIDGLTSSPFSATTLPPIAQPATHYVDDIIAASREQYARPRAEVEEIIIKFHEPTPKAPVASKASIAVAPKMPVAAAPVKAPPVVAKPPVVHQPFKAAFQAVPVVAVSKPVVTSKPVEAPKQAPIIKPAPIAKPVSIPAPPKPTPIPPPKPPIKSAPAPASSPLPLSSLNKNVPSTSKLDPKIPTTDNVNQLKSALMAALAKSKEKREEKPPVPKLHIAIKPPQNTQPRESRKELAQDRPAQPAAQPPKEVPEDVLKKVLKID